MPAPIPAPSTYGNLIPDTALAPGRGIAAFIRAAGTEVRFTFLLATGPTAPTLPTLFSVCPVFGELSPIALTADIPAGSTSLPLTSTLGLHAGQAIGVVHAGGAGEVATTTGVGDGRSIPVPPTAYAYRAGDAVYLLEDPYAGTHAPSEPDGRWLPDRTRIWEMRTGPGDYLVWATNTDRSAAVTVSVTSDATISTYG